MGKNIHILNIKYYKSAAHSKFLFLVRNYIHGIGSDMVLEKCVLTSVMWKRNVVANELQTFPNISRRSIFRTLDTLHTHTEIAFLHYPPPSGRWPNFSSLQYKFLTEI